MSFPGPIPDGQLLVLVSRLLPFDAGSTRVSAHNGRVEAARFLGCWSGQLSSMFSLRDYFLAGFDASCMSDS